MKRVNTNNYQLKLDFFELAKDNEPQELEIIEEIETINETGEILYYGAEDWCVKLENHEYEVNMTSRWGWYKIECDRGVYTHKNGKKYILSIVTRYLKKEDGIYDYLLNFEGDEVAWNEAELGFSLMFQRQKDMNQFILSGFKKKELIWDPIERWGYDPEETQTRKSKKKQKEVEELEIEDE